MLPIYGISGNRDFMVVGGVMSVLYGGCMLSSPKKRVFGDLKYFSEAPYANWRFEVYRNDRVFCLSTAYGAILCGTPFATCHKRSGPKKHSKCVIPHME